MQVKLSADRKRVLPVNRRSKQRLTGAKRRGIQAADLLLAMTHAGAGRVQQPRVEKPRVLIETMRVHGGDDLTARDQALYEGLLALARLHGLDAEKHTVRVSDLLAYLKVRPEKGDASGLRSVDRLVESMDRIAKTVVSYDLASDGKRKRATFGMLVFETTEGVKSGADTVTYSIPFPVRQAVLDSVSYAKLEINAFPLFKCKYTARLYQRLALRAGHSIPEPWSIDPRQLADELGWPTDRWHYGSFRRDCLNPALKDIEKHVARFVADVEERRGTGRGRPVERLVFRMSAARTMLEEAQAYPVTKNMRVFLESEDPNHGLWELPDADALARAAGVVRRSPDELMLGFRAALDNAKMDPSCNVGGAKGFMSGGELLNVLRKRGPRDALDEWIQTLPFGVEVDAPPRSSARPVTPPPPMRPRALPVPDWPDEQEETAVVQHDVFDDLDDDDIEPPLSFYRDEPQPTGEVVDDIPF